MAYEYGSMGSSYAPKSATNRGGLTIYGQDAGTRWSPVRTETPTGSIIGGGIYNPPADLPWTPASNPPPKPDRPGSTNGGGGYSAPRINASAIMASLNRYRPQQYKPEMLKLQQYKPPAFYGFNDSTYEMMKQQIAKSIAQARTTGMNAYGEARQQLNNIPVAFQGGATTTDPGMSAAMQRMFAANDTPLSINEQTLNEGVQADAAFGNVMALLGEAARQRRTSDVTALGGDERRLNETLDQQQTMMQFQADFARAEALRQYEIEKWQFGEEVARMNWEVRNAQIAANTQTRNDAQMTNVDAANQANQAANQTIIDLLAQGVAIDPAAYQSVKV